jgi:hypothetical protein
MNVANQLLDESVDATLDQEAGGHWYAIYNSGSFRAP